MNWKKVRILGFGDDSKDIDFFVGELNCADAVRNDDLACEAIKTLFSRSYVSSLGNFEAEANGEYDGRDIVAGYKCLNGKKQMNLSIGEMKVDYCGFDIPGDFLVTTKDDAYQDWSCEVEGLLSPLIELFEIRSNIYESFSSIPCNGKYHETSIRDSIDEHSSIEEMANFTHAFAPLYREDLKRLEECQSALKNRLEKAKRAYDTRRRYDDLLREVSSLRQKIVKKKSEIESTKAQIEYIKGFEEGDKIIEGKIRELERDEDFYVRHDEREKRILELTKEVEDLKGKVSDYKTERRSLESVAKSNREQNERLPRDLDERYAALEREYDECVENEKLFKEIKLKLVEVDEAAERCEAAEGIYYSSLEQLEDEKDISSKNCIDELNKQVESDKSCWMAQHEYVESLRKECVRDLERFGVKDFPSVRARLPKLLAENARVMEEKRNEGSLVGSQIAKRDFANKGIYLRDIRVPQIDEQLKLLELNIKDNQAQIASLQKTYDEEIKGKEFISHQDFVNSIERERMQIEEHKNVLRQNEAALEGLNAEAKEISRKLKDREDELSSFFDVPNIPLSNLSIEVNSTQTSLDETNAEVMQIKAFISASENFEEISSVYLSSYKAQDRLVMALEEIAISKEVNLDRNGFKKSIIDYIIDICDKELANEIFQKMGRHVEFKRDGEEIEFYVDGVRIERNQDSDSSILISCMRKSMFVNWLVYHGILDVAPIFCCVLDNGNDSLFGGRLPAKEALKDILFLDKKKYAN